MPLPAFTHRRAVLIAVVVVAIAACGSSATPTPSRSPVPSPAASSTASIAPSPTPSTEPSPAASPTAASPSVGQTDTEWGRIWDAPPATFPVYPGSTTTEIGHASTDQRIVEGDVGEVAAWYQAALETAGYSTEAASGPLEDGSVVIDSVGEPLTCRVQVRIAPAGGMVMIDVYVGAECPFE